jgi:hypothetical protein
MVDTCIVCTDHLATVTFACGHRSYCNSCFTEGGEITAICPYDRSAAGTVQDSTTIQLQEVTIQEHLPMYDALKAVYPFGCKLFANEQVPAENLPRIVEEAARAVIDGVIPLADLRKRLRRHLTMEQYDLVFVELLRNQDLFGVLQQLDRKKTEKFKTTKYVKSLIIKTVEETDAAAIGMRAVAGSVGGTTFNAASKGVSGLTSSFYPVDGVSSSAVFAIFSAIEVYRWSRGDIDGMTALVNIGEHAVGTSNGFLGGWGGAIAGGLAGAALGSVVPVIGTVIGGIAGTILGMFFCGAICDATGRWIYRKFLPRKEMSTVETEEEESHQLTPREIAERAAKKFHVNLDKHSFAKAQRRFRQALLRSHPDKNPHASLEEKERLQVETRDILACWCVVREYYKDHPTSSSRESGDEDDIDESQEGYIKIQVLRVFNAISNSWDVKRCFFDIVSLGRPVNPESERLQEMVLYV